MSGMATRERILGTLRAAAPAPAPDCSGLEQRINRHHAQGALRSATPRQRADVMERIMTSVRTEVWRSDAASWPALLADKLAQAGVQRLLLDPGKAEGAALAAAV